MASLPAPAPHDKVNTRSNSGRTNRFKNPVSTETSQLQAAFTQGSEGAKAPHRIYPTQTRRKV